MISVIVPIYNVAPYLRDSLDSLIAQTFTDWEAICVDDGSTDESARILDEYAARDSRIEAIHQTNAGVGSARNRGLSSARGECIAFLDPDDVIRPGAFEQLMILAKVNQTADLIIFADCAFHDKEWPKWSESNESRLIDVSTSIPGCVCRECAWGALYKKDVIPKQGFKSYRLGEDILFMAESLCKAKQVVLTSYCAYGYRVRAGSALRMRLDKGRLLDKCSYLCDWAEALWKSGKKIDPRTYRQIGLGLTEGFVSDLREIDVRDRSEMWAKWYCVLKWMRRRKVFSPWTHIVVTICLLIRSRLLARLFCEVPHMMKMKGFHR